MYSVATARQNMYMCGNERNLSGTVRLQGSEVTKVEDFNYIHVGSTVQRHTLRTMGYSSSTAMRLQSAVNCRGFSSGQPRIYWGNLIHRFGCLLLKKGTTWNFF